MVDHGLLRVQVSRHPLDICHPSESPEPRWSGYRPREMSGLTNESSCEYLSGLLHGQGQFLQLMGVL